MIPTTAHNDIGLTLYGKMALLLDVGQLLMESGSSSRRLVQNMLATADYLDISPHDIQIHIAYSTIMVNINTDTHAETMFRKCPEHNVDMTTMLRLTFLNRQAYKYRFPYSYYRNALRTVADGRRRGLYSPAVRIGAAATACGAFCLLFGGDVTAALYTGLAAAVGGVVRLLAGHRALSGYIGIALAACIATVIAYLSVNVSHSATPWLPMIACTLFLIPGVPLINAIDDLLNNYLSAGMTRAVHTSLLILSITFGIVCAVMLCPLPQFTEINIVPHTLHLTQALAAGLGAAGFSVIFHIPRRFLPMIVPAAILAMELRNVLLITDAWSMAAASCAGAAAVSTLCFVLSHRFHAPIFIVVIPALIPLVPGVLLYRLLFSIIHVQTLTAISLIPAIQNGVTALLTCIGIAVGAALPDALGYQVMRRRR